ncbi:hypothetical protein A2U01_0034748, partial [Trifolium medium]|nr:hypothetical protein [Trifolium medium]
SSNLTFANSWRTTKMMNTKMVQKLGNEERV